MSIIIEGMDMPKCCGSCEFNNGYRCTRTETVIDRDYEYQERLSDCPLHEGKLKEWIPVSERLPEEGQRQLVLFCDIDEDIMVGYHIDGRPDTHFTDYWTGDDVEDVIAWMLLPEPYKVEREDAGIDELKQ